MVGKQKRFKLIRRDIIIICTHRGRLTYYMYIRYTYLKYVTIIYYVIIMDAYVIARRISMSLQQRSGRTAINFTSSSRSQRRGRRRRPLSRQQTQKYQGKHSNGQGEENRISGFYFLQGPASRLVCCPWVCI